MLFALRLGAIKKLNRWLSKKDAWKTVTEVGGNNFRAFFH